MGKNADVLEFFIDKVRVVVDLNPFGVLLLVKSIEVEALGFVLADVVTNHDITIRPFHDAAEPMVVVAVVVLNEGVDAVEVRIETAAVDATFTGVPISLVVLNFDTVGLKAKNTVAGIVTTAVG